MLIDNKKLYFYFVVFKKIQQRLAFDYFSAPTDSIRTTA
jgi:hypothetical protein